MGLLGMLLNKEDADAISSDLHHLTMQTLQEGNLRHQKSHRRVERTHDLMGQQAAMLAAIKIQELNDRIAFLEKEVALCDARIAGYKGMRNKLLDMDDPKVAQAYLYQHWRIEDRALDQYLASGRLKEDPRLSEEWREQNDYVPPKQSADEQASNTTPPPLPAFEDLEVSAELTKTPQQSANAQAPGSATPPPLPSFQDLD